MKVLHAVLGAVAVAFTLASVAAADPDTAKQRVAITMQAGGTTTVSPFVLAPLQTGAIKRDTGTQTGAIPVDRVVMREGQEVQIYDGLIALKGKRGTLGIRYRSEYVDGGNGYHVGTGSWRVDRGTGQYAGITGGGRAGHVWLDSGPWSSRLEGFLILQKGT